MGNMPTTQLACLWRTLAASAVLVLAGCSSLERLPAVPGALQYEASVPGMPNIRYRQPQVDELLKDLRTTVAREQDELRKKGYDGPLLPISFLALSGGGENGAFGAGLLVGWTARGDRPEFNIVTGISTGALIAPFAFLGPRYDAQLKRLYTEIAAHDVLELRIMVGALFEDALADNLPLQRLVAANVTQEILDAIADESRKGRMLLVGTTDLDAQRSVYWNLTLMAESRSPQALALIRKILVASAAIPGELPPAMIDVEAQGKHYQEMHVDGGTTQQVFMLPPEIVITSVARRERTIYVIRNSRMAVESTEVKRDALSIAGRAVSSLIDTQGIGNLYEIAAQARRDGAHFRLAHIPDSFDRELNEPFDRQYMNELFLIGYKLGAAGYPWATRPPGLVAGDGD
jgi:predicted acylesterase/phospholipase RssA